MRKALRLAPIFLSKSNKTASGNLIVALAMLHLDSVLISETFLRFKGTIVQALSYNVLSERPMIKYNQLMFETNNETLQW